MKYFGGVVKETAVTGGTTLAAKTGTLKQKVQSKEWGKNVMSMFGKKPAAPSNADEEEKEADA